MNNGIEVSQEGFIRELLRSHEHGGGRAKTQGAKEILIMSVEEEADMLMAAPIDLKGKEHLVKEAQRRVGEMLWLWLSSRSRPDIQYATAVMSSRITRCPEAVITIGDRLLDYLNETMYDRVRFANDDGGLQELITCTDSSFAPSSGRNHGSIAIFYGSSPLAWRSSRQPLISLSTAETELMEGVEGAIMTFATKCLLDEILGVRLPVQLRIDNSAAISLMTTAAGSWRTRHLRLHSNWIRERINQKEIFVKHEPGLTQRADIGTKPFSKDRLDQLKSLWNIKDRRVRVTSSKMMNVKPWFHKLLLLCQICGVQGVKENIQPGVPWDLYIVVIVMALAVIGVWEPLKHCVGGRQVRVQILKVKAEQSASRRITRNTLKELQLLMSTSPQDLSDTQKVRLMELFDESAPPNSSPVPTVREERPSSSSSSVFHKQPRTLPTPPAPSVTTREQRAQKDPPVFERVEAPPAPQVRLFTSPFFLTDHGDKIHVFENCRGLRNNNRWRTVQLCRCCAENNGNRIY